MLRCRPFPSVMTTCVNNGLASTKLADPGVSGYMPIAAQTYQGVGMKLSTPMLRQTAMTVGGVEARHMAILAHFLTPPMTVPAAAFQPVDKAVDASFYV